MKKILFIILIFLLAFSLRFYRHSVNPPSLYWDEVSMGYNAWSILTTGADEYGQRNPLLFESFQEYKLPGYIYLLVPFVKFFGLNETSVRLPSVFLGALTAYFLYLLVSQLINKKSGLIASLLLAVSPWGIQFSRAGFEATAGLSLVILGMYFFFRGLKGNKYLLLSCPTLFLSLYFYNSLRVFIPLLGLSYVFLFRQQLIGIYKRFVLSLFLGFLILSPLIIKFTSPVAFNRFSQVSILSDSNILNESISQKDFDRNNLFSRIFHHRYFVITKKIIDGYFSHYTYSFLFSGNEANVRHHVPSVGLLYIWLVGFILIGIYYLIRYKHSSLKIILPWLLISPIASSFTSPTPHALRSLVILPILLLLSGYGMYIVFNRPGNLIKKTVMTGLILWIIFESSNYLHQLFNHYPYQSSKEWAYGYKQTFNFLATVKDRYNRIFVTGRYWRPYIFALFYLEYPPEKYQKNPSHDQIDNIYFGFVGYDSSDPYYNYEKMQGILEKMRSEPNSLLILSPEEKSDNDHVIYSINDLQGQPLFFFVDNHY